ncbi:type II toxin-antitoxin system MqsR family toxin [Leptospira licerasiae]|uniref:type II toxin-antitoxin system MqsR family toxin n=1 Tax=Leptospira licerasiae TaxID=447106 RepID=UPI001082DBDA|nr:type II toxin-antitoxin system MqsR family toxin [Leptospira licerasiae]TGM87893.1 type II toxin-antitoxin system MqsR family toxin [Leptospira licerasiae]
MKSRKPRFSLERIRDLIRSGNVVVTSTAQKDALEEFGLSEDEVKEEVLKLSSANFVESAPSKNFPGDYLDVYKQFIVGCKEEAYIKLQIREDFGVIVSFHLFGRM